VGRQSEIEKKKGETTAPLRPAKGNDIFCVTGAKEEGEHDIYAFSAHKEEPEVTHTPLQDEGSEEKAEDY